MKLEAEVAGRTHQVDVTGSEGRLQVVFDGRPLAVDARAMEGFFNSILVDGSAYEVTVGPESDGWRVQAGIEAYHVSFLDPLRPTRSAPGAAGAGGGRKTLASLMPGKVVRVNVKDGDDVAEGQALLVVEAMKMENEVQSPRAGRVLEVKVAPGETVETGSPLIVIG